MNTTRTGLVAAGASLAGLLLAACFTPQPVPECQVITSQELYSVSNYLALLTPVGTPSGTCPSLTTLEVGLERFHTPKTKDFSLGVRASRIVDISNGYANMADTDATNDCTDGKNCSSCVVGGDPAAENVCIEVLEPQKRTDPKDPREPNDPKTPKKLTGITPLTQFPDKAGLCKATDLKVSQDFRAEDLPLVDGGVLHLDELPVTMQWTDLNVIMNGKIPGTAFTSKLKLTEGSCVANYDVVGFWPLVSCNVIDENPDSPRYGLFAVDDQGHPLHDDRACDPFADVDAGRPTGSGINPDFKPVCKLYVDDRFKAPGEINHVQGIYDPNPFGESWICTPTVDLTTLK